MTAIDAGVSAPPSSRKRIAFDAHVLDGRYQGTRTVISRLARCIAERHPDISTILYASNDPNIEGVQHVPFETSSAFSRLLFELPRRSRRDNLDVLFYQYICAPWSINSWVFIHDILPVSHPKFFSKKFIIRCALLYLISSLFAKRVVSVSNYTAESIKKFAPIIGRKVLTVRNGPSFENEVYFCPKSRSSIDKFIGGGRYILAVGRIEERKNIPLLVGAFVGSEVFSAYGVKLVIAGGLEPDHPSIAGAGVVHLSGLAEDQLIALHANADLFVYPSMAEGFGLPLLDSVLFGIPTISSNLTAMPEVGGDLVEYFDPSAANASGELARRIRGHFAGAPVRAPSLEERKLHAELFSWERSADVLAAEVRKTFL